MTTSFDYADIENDMDVILYAVEHWELGMPGGIRERLAPVVKKIRMATTEDKSNLRSIDIV